MIISSTKHMEISHTSSWRFLFILRSMCHTLLSMCNTCTRTKTPAQQQPVKLQVLELTFSPFFTEFYNSSSITSKHNMHHTSHQSINLNSPWIKYHLSLLEWKILWKTSWYLLDHQNPQLLLRHRTGSSSSVYWSTIRVYDTLVCSCDTPFVNLGYRSFLAIHTYPYLLGST